MIQPPVDSLQPVMSLADLWVGGLQVSSGHRFTCAAQGFDGEEIVIKLKNPVRSMKSDAPSRPLAFEPAVVLLISAMAATFYGIYLLKSQTVGFHTFRLSGTFLYVVPIVVPFVAFLLDRAEHINETLYYRVNQQSDSARPNVAWGLETTKGTLVLRSTVDVLILIVAIGRAVANVPLVSGHTLFLSYAIFSSRSRVVVVTATLVMLHVVYLKYFVWHDAVTSTSGIVLGCLSAYLVNRFTTSGKDHRDG